MLHKTKPQRTQSSQRLYKSEKKSNVFQIHTSGEVWKTNRNNMNSPEIKGFRNDTKDIFATFRSI